MSQRRHCLDSRVTPPPQVVHFCSGDISLFSPFAIARCSKRCHISFSTKAWQINGPHTQHRQQRPTATHSAQCGMSHMHSGMCADTCTDMCTHMFTDMCTDVCAGMCIEVCNPMHMRTHARRGDAPSTVVFINYLWSVGFSSESGFTVLAALAAMESSPCTRHTPSRATHGSLRTARHIRSTRQASRCAWPSRRFITRPAMPPKPFDDAVSDCFDDASYDPSPTRPRQHHLAHPQDIQQKVRFQKRSSATSCMRLEGGMHLVCFSQFQPSGHVFF